MPISLTDLQEFAVMVLLPLSLISGVIIIAALITVAFFGLLDNVFNH